VPSNGLAPFSKPDSAEPGETNASGSRSDTCADFALGKGLG